MENSADVTFGSCMTDNITDITDHCFVNIPHQYTSSQYIYIQVQWTWRQIMGEMLRQRGWGFLQERWRELDRTEEAEIMRLTQSRGSEKLMSSTARWLLFEQAKRKTQLSWVLYVLRKVFKFKFVTILHQMTNFFNYMFYIWTTLSHFGDSHPSYSQ